MPNPSKRMTANPARPVARYRPGKAVQEDTSSEEDVSEDESQKQPGPGPAQPRVSSFPAEAQRRQVSAQRAQQEESEDEEGFVTEEDDEGEASGVALPAAHVEGQGRRVVQKPTTSAISRTTEANEISSAGEEGSEDSEEESDEEEESSSEEEPHRKFQRPTFIKKSDRGKVGSTNGNLSHNAATNGAVNTSPAIDTIRADELRRKEMADLMIKDKLERDAAARAAGRKGWDDDDEVAAEDMVDDTDGLDPEAEYAAWKLRELKRLKRDREAIEQREKEIEEVERRRNLTQAEREAEDREYLEKQKEEKEDGRGKAGFLQRYHHKGAFFQDDETAEILRKRDLMSAKFVDEVQNREALPQYMQVRDMTKLGKKGRTRYTDLKGEDTGKWGQGYDQKERRGPKPDFDVDERFKPDHDGGAKGPTGANASTVRDRRDKTASDTLEGPRAMRNGDYGRNGGEWPDSYRLGRQSRTQSRSTSRHRDRYEDEDSRSRRKRGPSPYRERDKRRRIDAS